jgi:hypothetical protein
VTVVIRRRAVVPDVWDARGDASETMNRTSVGEYQIRLRYG